MDSQAAFFVMKPTAIFGVIGAQARCDLTRCDLRSIPMALRPFASQLSVVTAYLAFAFVGAIVLGVF
jgi:hypothetical protein